MSKGGDSLTLVLFYNRIYGSSPARCESLKLSLPRAMDSGQMVEIEITTAPLHVGSKYREDNMSTFGGNAHRSNLHYVPDPVDYLILHFHTCIHQISLLNTHLNHIFHIPILPLSNRSRWWKT